MRSGDWASDKTGSWQRVVSDATFAGRRTSARGYLVVCLLSRQAAVVREPLGRRPAEGSSPATLSGDSDLLGPRRERLLFPALPRLDPTDCLLCTQRKQTEAF
mgnify:CR=1 FL=1